MDKTSTRMKDCCLQFLPPFKHVFLDLKGLKERYLSDYKDAFLPENVPIVFIGMIFIYFVVLSPAITFGALFSKLFLFWDIYPCLSNDYEVLDMLISDNYGIVTCVNH